MLVSHTSLLIDNDSTVCYNNHKHNNEKTEGK